MAARKDIRLDMLNPLVITNGSQHYRGKAPGLPSPKVMPARTGACQDAALPAVVTPMPASLDLFAAPARPSTNQPRIRCGIGGWVFPEWRDNFYPAGLVQRRELEYASRQLRSIEINGTYYRAPAATTLAGWAKQVPDGFVFSLKAPKAIVLQRSLAGASRMAAAFVDTLQALGDRLGPVVWQFTPARRFDADDLAAFLDRLPRTLDGQPLRHALEVRHASFRCTEYVTLARTHGVATVFTDSPEHPSLADLTGPFAYARLMRSQADEPHGYPAGALDAWAERATQWRAGGDPPELPHVEAPRPNQAARDVFVYFISAAKARNPAAAMALQARVARTG
jgi:uncharacterized protein YecE (DUF72 family)